VTGYLLTGATGPVAEAVIAVLAGRGERLLLTGRNDKRLAELAETYDAETFAVDVTLPEGAESAAAETVRCFGGIAGLVHLVGSFQAGPVMRTAPEQFEDLMRVNYLSAVYTTRAVLPHLKDGGRVVFFGSPLAAEPLPALSGYAASKAALLAWARSFSHEVKGRGIHVNAVVMSMADTPEARRERPHVDFDHAVTPELVARTVGFLTSEAADGLYGSLVPVQGRFGFSSALAGPPPRPAG
jgi:NAD(P)-dependent dehydrogenase (short-subunit alcohol dehydrogenase family)